MTLQQTFEAAMAQQQAGRPDQAEALYRQILAVDPNQPAVYHRLSLLVHRMNRNAEAIELMRQAIRIAPHIVDFHIDLSVILFTVGRNLEAHDACRQAIALRPDDYRIWNNLAFLLQVIERPQEAVEACRKAISLKPDAAECYDNLGVSLAAAGLPQEAEQAYRKSIALNPHFPNPYNDLAITLCFLDRREEAVAALRQAVAIKPDYADAYTNLGNALSDLALHDEAIAAYRRGVSLMPHRDLGYQILLLGLNYHPATTGELLLEESRAYARNVAAPLKAGIRPHTNDRSPDCPLRVGYISADFRFHSVAYFLLPLLQAHDKNAVQAFCYPVNPNTDATTIALRAAATGWQSIVGLAPEQIADIVRRDKIDILVDLGGHTAHSRLLTFAQRPAPVQISWLGYPATSGLDTIDYRLTDSIADPPSSATDATYTEKLLRLPQTAWCYAPLSGSPSIAPPPHLANHHITFGSLNNFAKLNDETLHLWARLLEQVPHSRLMLRVPAGPQTAARIHQIFAAHRITPDRLDLILREFANTAHMLRYNKIDIALDTFPYNGTTTTCEALWMGVPVITLAGNRHASRVGASLLTTIGHGELIAHTAEEFLTLAQTLAADSPRLQSLRTTLREQMHSSPLMNAPAFARNIEAAYRQMWHAWCNAVRL